MITVYGLQLHEYYDFITPLKTEKNVDIYIDTKDYHSNNNMKIYIQSEPNSVLNHIDYLKINHDKYDWILRYDDISLPYNNCITHKATVTWIKDLTNDLTKKEFKISTLCGHKTTTIGHRLRQQLYYRQLELSNYPITFFRSSAINELLPNINNNPLIKKDLEYKIDLFKNFQFSLVIENCRERNYYSEKIIDCVITKTIPIYYGCVNIKDFFDTTGWILLETDNIVDELKEKLQCITPDYYNNHLEIVEKNYLKALEYSDFSKHYVDVLTKIPGIYRKE